ncbi:MAG TPA: glycosyltransferase [Pyrinomonadaceae bacterium]|nr:glycosyltransferase [Pyrinomonadaceae bacterium]
MVTTLVQKEIAPEATRDGPTNVAVVVPSYNHGRFIGTTLRSIMKQSLWPAQLLVIDDGSTDDSVRVIERELSNCAFPCEFVARENRGLCATLNEGFARTSGDYFAYLGSDDLWLPEFLHARVELLEKRPDAALAYGHAYFIDEENRIIDCTADWATYADGDARQMLLATTAPMSPTVVYRRTALENNLWDETARLEDYDLYLRLSTVGDFAFDPRVLSAWRRHGSNVSWNQTLMLDEQLKAQREAALKFGFTLQGVEKLQTETRFRRAEDFLRVGQKSEALKLLRENLRGAHASPATAKILLRLLIPTSFMRGRARAKQRSANHRYGTLDV